MFLSNRKISKTIIKQRIEISFYKLNVILIYDTTMFIYKTKD